MGLDFFDITCRIETRFEISFVEDEIVDLGRDGDIAVADLYELVLTKLHVRDTARHDLRLNFELWFTIQQTLESVTGVPDDAIALNTRLEDLFPRQTRRLDWHALREVSGYRLRELEYPTAIRVTGFLLTVSMVTIDLIPIWQIPGIKLLWPLLALFGMSVCVETYLKLLSIASPLRICFPSEMKTVKDLCRFVVAGNYDVICRDAEIPLDERCLDVWHELTAILSDVLCIEPEAISFKSRLVHDLGMG